MKNRLTRFLKNLISKGRNVNKDQCSFCKDIIDEFNENEFYGINFKTYCSLRCYYDEDKIKTQRSDSKAKNSSQTNKTNKSKNRVHKKKSKQKKSKK